MCTQRTLSSRQVVLKKRCLGNGKNHRIKEMRNNYFFFGRFTKITLEVFTHFAYKYHQFEISFGICPMKKSTYTDLPCLWGRIPVRICPATTTVYPRRSPRHIIHPFQISGTKDLCKVLWSDFIHDTNRTRWYASQDQH